MPFATEELMNTSLQTRPKQSPWLSHAVRVRSVVLETPGVATYQMEFVDAEVAQAYQFKPGQFNMLYVPGVGEAAISVSSSAHHPQLLRHTIREVGGVTRAIAEGGRGMSLGLRGPFGSSWPVENCCPDVSEKGSQKDVILVAGGIGLAPLRPLVYALSQNRNDVGRVVVLAGARSPADLLFRDEYEIWREQGIEVQATVDRADGNWRGNIGVVTSLLARLVVPRPENCLVMTCGPEVMMRYVAQSAVQRGIPVSNIWVSLERNMNCAVGLCGHCQLGPEFLCKDGPVLAYPRIANWLKVQAL
jgi:NAD(P)H-flavin reductase